MDSVDKPTAEEDSSAFMLAEYNALRELRQNLIAVGENRLNFFLTTTSGAGVALALINQLTGYKDATNFVSGVVLVGLFLFGLSTYIRMIERDINVTLYTRGMNRIRVYFTEQNPKITKYLILPAADDRPLFRALGSTRRSVISTGVTGLVVIINSTIATVSLVLLLIGILAVPLVVTSIAGVLIFAGLLIAQQNYYARRLEKMEKATPVLFPSGTPPSGDSPADDPG